MHWPGGETAGVEVVWGHQQDVIVRLRGGMVVHDWCIERRERKNGWGLWAVLYVCVYVLRGGAVSARFP